MAARGGIVSRLKKKKVEEVVSAGKRMDGRGLEDYRQIEYERFKIFWGFAQSHNYDGDA